MKNKFKIFLSFLMAVIMCFSVSCKKNNKDSGNLDNGGDGVIVEQSDIKYSKNNAIAINGRSNYKIVIADNAIGTEVHAAQELSNYIKKATGATLAVVRESYIKNISTNMNLISVGNTELFKSSGLDYSDIDFNKDGFIQKTVDRTLFVCGGQSQRSHIYAAYDLLEKCLGIRFFTPECEKVPTNQNLYLPLLDVVDVPAFGIRFVTYDSLMDNDFSVKSRMMTSLNNYRFNDTYGEGSMAYFWDEPHNITNKIVPYSIYGSSNPEWFYNSDAGYINFIPTYGVNADGTYDDTLEINPVDIAFETLKKAMIETEESCYFYHCSQNDGGLPPTNKEFVERAQKIGNSGVYIQFYNLVIEKLDAWIESETRPDGLFPNGKDYQLLTFAYMITKNPPLNEKGEPAIKIHDNLSIWLAPIDANLLYSIDDPLQGSSETALVEGWFKCTKNVCIWDYYANFWGDFNLYYTPYITTAQRSYQVYYENGVKDYVLSQMRGHSVGPRSACPELKTYMASKLMWDPYRYDSWDLVREYCDYYYGDYSEEVLGLIYNIEDYLAIVSNDGNTRFMNHSLINHAEFFPLNILNNGINVLDNCLEDLNKSNLSNSEKIAMRERLEEFQLMLLSHIVFEYGSYHNGDMSGYATTTNKFFNLIDSTKWSKEFFGEGISPHLSTKNFQESLENYFLPK